MPAPPARMRRRACLGHQLQLNLTRAIQALEGSHLAASAGANWKRADGFPHLAVFDQQAAVFAAGSAGRPVADERQPTRAVGHQSFDQQRRGVSRAKTANHETGAILDDLDRFSRTAANRGKRHRT